MKNTQLLYNVPKAPDLLVTDSVSTFSLSASLSIQNIQIISIHRHMSIIRMLKH
jgi:hypothetical protein